MLLSSVYNSSLIRRMKTTWAASLQERMSILEEDLQWENYADVSTRLFVLFLT